MTERATQGGRARGSAASWLLVAAQGVIFLAIVVVPAAWGPSVPSLPVIGVALCAMGAAGSLVAVVSLGGALTALPEPNGAGMTARGAYRWVRHPMYSAVVLGFLGVAALRGAAVSWILVGVLAAFFELKTRREERFLRAAYPGYASYALRTGKFVPRWHRRVDHRQR